MNETTKIEKPTGLTDPVQEIVMPDQIVIPNLEFTPDRKYERNGNIITCYEIESVTGSAMSPVHNCKNTPMFTLDLATEDHAKALMDDLYRGEYTGA